MSNNLISQAGQLQLSGFPNDAIQILNPIACIILGSLIQNLVYPLLARYRIPFGPIARMAMALLIMAAGMAYAAGVQQLIYNQGPCYDAPLQCPAAQQDPTKAPDPNNIETGSRLLYMFSWPHRGSSASQRSASTATARRQNICDR